jgi:ATP-binding cassette subfamily B protein
VLDDVSLTLPAARSSPIVGENGAGKTTLVKLLAKMYEPSSGAISSTTRRWRGMPADAWRARLAGALPGFLPLRVPRADASARRRAALDDDAAVVRAVERAGAGDVVES